MRTCFFAAILFVLYSPLMAETAVISKVSTEQWPAARKSAMDYVISFNHTGTLSYLMSNRPSEFRYEVAVRWSTEAPLEGVTVRFEYRQTNRDAPESKELDFPRLKAGSRWSRFTLKGAAYEKGGDVAAWKISVIHNGDVIAAKHSTLWIESSPPSAAQKP